MKIDLKTSIFGIIGYPLGHSLSPLMHNTAFRLRGLNAIYLFFETQEIENAIKGIKALGIKGVSVTIPYKSDVLPFLDRIDSLAENIGAVNTISLCSNSCKAIQAAGINHIHHDGADGFSAFMYPDCVVPVK